MLIVVLTVVLATLAWLVIRRMHAADPAARRASLRALSASIAIVVAVRVSLVAPLALRIAIAAFALGALVVWLRGRGGGGGGDDGPDPPVDPDPDPAAGQRHPLRRERLDEDEFDRARGEWEHALPERAPD
jgi:hypothetical protein